MRIKSISPLVAGVAAIAVAAAPTGGVHGFGGAF